MRKNLRLKADEVEEQIVKEIPQTLLDCVSQTSTFSMQGKSVLGFKEAIRAAEEQIEVRCFPRHQADYAKDICRVIAEVYMLPESAQIKIEGEMLPAAMVKEVFHELTSEHAEYVANEISGYDGRIFAMKPFIRTMLYNAVLTMETAITHEVEQEVKHEMQVSGKDI
jgi:hypothetical protein